MLKLKLTTLEGLPAEVAKEYKKEGDGYVLDTDVAFEDTTALKNALVQEKKHRKEATERVTVLEGSVATLEARAGSAGDVEKSWQDKLKKAEDANKARVDGLNSQLRTVLVDNVAQQMAQEIATVPNLMLPILKSRLTIEEQDGKMITRVLDAEGKASALSVNELKAEIVANKEFAPIIKASDASGGGASGGGKGTPVGDKKFSEMSESEKVALHRSNPAKFKQMADAASPA